MSLPSTSSTPSLLARWATWPTWRRLRGARTVVVGIAPDVAMSLVRLAVHMPLVQTALDLEEGLLCLAS